jgi:hypothetical protein
MHRPATRQLISLVDLNAVREMNGQSRDVTEAINIP